MNYLKTSAPVAVFGSYEPTISQNALSIRRELRVLNAGGMENGKIQRGMFSCSLTGTAIYGKDALLSATEVSKAVEQVGDVENFIDSWGRRAKNPCAVMIVDHSAARVLILPDPLGGCIVFSYKSGETTFVSPDLESLVNAADARGMKPKKSLTYQLERSVLGNGGLTDASYEGVQALRMMDYAEITQEGLIVKSYRVKREYLEAGTSYSAVIDDYRQDVLDSVQAITRINDARIAHLTGGFDSRLVLASIMNGCQESEFRFFCSGPIGTADRDTADGLSASLGIIRTHDAGLSMATPVSIEEKFLAPMMNSAGLTSSGPLGTEPYSGAVVAGGGYGGLLRSVFSTHLSESVEQLSSDAIADKFWGAPAMALSGLMTGASRDGILNRLTDALSELRIDGYEDDYLGDAFYLTHRNRYHFGQNSILWSRVGRRYDPLYSLQGPRLARMLPIHSRKTNVAGFDVMASMQPDLLSYPFDRDRFTGEYPNLRRIPAIKNFDSTAPKFLSKPTPPRPAAAPIDQELRKKQVLQSRKMGVNFWQIESMTPAQAGLSSLLRDMDISDLEQAVNPTYVLHLSKDTLKTRSEIRHLYAVYSMLLWYTKS